MPRLTEPHLPDDEEADPGAGHTLLRKLLWVAVLAAATVVCATGSPLLAQETLAAGDASGACNQTTQQLARSCAQDVRAEYAEALAVCVNLSKPAERDRCTRQAASDLRAAPGECDAQEQVRRRVCQAIGQAPYDPVIRPANFTTTIDNPYFPLRPGTVFTYKVKGEDEVVVVEVLRRTVTILGVRCVVVRDTVTVDGELEEDTFDYYAQDRAGNVWYFGETTAEFVDGLVVSTDGSFIGGVDGAKPGIIMLADPEPGTTYREEFFLDEAEDVARVERLNASGRVPYGRFSGALETFNYVPIEPDARENKYYARGVGNVLTVNLETGQREELISIRRK